MLDVARSHPPEFTPWMAQDKFLALPSQEQSILHQLISANPSLSRARKLAPIEVFQRGQSDLQKLPGFLLPVLLGPKFGIERTVRNGLFEWQDMTISPDPIRFLARTVPCQSVKSVSQLPDGEKYLTYLNPFAPTELILCTAKGGYIGTCSPWNSPCRSDVESIHRQMGLVKKIEAELLAPVARRGAALARETLEMHRHNAAILQSSLTRPTPSDPRLKDLAGNISEFLEAESQPASTAEPSPEQGAESLL